MIYFALHKEVSIRSAMLPMWEARPLQTTIKMVMTKMKWKEEQSHHVKTDDENGVIMVGMAGRPKVCIIKTKDKKETMCNCHYKCLCYGTKCTKSTW